MQFNPVIFVFALIIALSISAVAALVWAIKTGQFQNFDRGATSIFDADEPIGRPTDGFPSKVPQRAVKKPDSGPSGGRS